MQYPLLSTQEAFVRSSGLEETTNTLPGMWEINGPYSADDLVHAVQRVVDGHDALRSVIVHSGRKLSQRVLDGGGVSPSIRRLTLGDNARETIRRELTGMLAVPFDLTQPPLWRGFVARVGRNRSVLCMAFAHVIADERSLAVFGRDLAETLRTRRRPNRPQLRLCVDAERHQTVSDGFVRFWQTQFSRRTALPGTWRADAHYRVHALPALAPGVVSGVGRLSHDLGVGPGITLAAAAAVAANAVLGCQRPMLGLATPRRTKENHAVFGPLADHVPVFGGAPDGAAFSELVRHIGQRAGMAQDYRLACGTIERIVTSTPFDVAVNYAPHASASTEYRVGNAGTVRPLTAPLIGPVAVSAPSSVAPVLALLLRPRRDGSIAGDLTAISALYTETEARNLANAFAAAVHNGLRAPDTAIERLVTRDF